MRRHFVHRVAFANITATLALFVSLGGGAYAAFTLPKNSVGKKQLKNGAVTGPKLAKGAVTAAKVARGSLTGAQIKAATLATVPSARYATDAGHAASADHATAADFATNAGHAVSAGSIPGLSYTHVVLMNGWSTVPGERPPEYAIDAQGVVHFEGAMQRTSGTSTNPFDVPGSLAPSGPPGSLISLAADQETGAVGQLLIGADGSVNVGDDPDHPGSAEAFTSLEGITYLPGA